MSPGFYVYGLMPEVFIEKRLNVRGDVRNRKKAGHCLSAFGAGLRVFIPPGDQILDPAMVLADEVIARHGYSMAEKGEKLYATMRGDERC